MVLDSMVFEVDDETELRLEPDPQAPARAFLLSMVACSAWQVEWTSDIADQGWNCDSAQARIEGTLNTNPKENSYRIDGLVPETEYRFRLKVPGKDIIHWTMPLDKLLATTKVFDPLGMNFHDECIEEMRQDFRVLADLSEGECINIFTIGFKGHGKTSWSNTVASALSGLCQRLGQAHASTDHVTNAFTQYTLPTGSRSDPLMPVRIFDPPGAPDQDGTDEVRQARNNTFSAIFKYMLDGRIAPSTPRAEMENNLSACALPKPNRKFAPDVVLLLVSWNHLSNDRAMHYLSSLISMARDAGCVVMVSVTKIDTLDSFKEKHDLNDQSVTNSIAALLDRASTILGVDPVYIYPAAHATTGKMSRLITALALRNLQKVLLTAWDSLSAKETALKNAIELLECKLQLSSNENERAWTQDLIEDRRTMLSSLQSKLDMLDAFVQKANQ